MVPDFWRNFIQLHNFDIVLIWHRAKVIAIYNSIKFASVQNIIFIFKYKDTTEFQNVYIINYLRIQPIKVQNGIIEIYKYISSFFKCEI